MVWRNFCIEIQIYHVISLCVLSVSRKINQYPFIISHLKNTGNIAETANNNVRVRQGWTGYLALVEYRVSSKFRIYLILDIHPYTRDCNCLFLKALK